MAAQQQPNMPPEPWETRVESRDVYKRQEYQQLQDEIKAAMKARDNHRRDILRQVHTELKAIEVNERREVTEADVDAMLKRTIKQLSLIHI